MVLLDMFALQVPGFACGKVTKLRRSALEPRGSGGAAGGLTLAVGVP